LLRDSSTSDRVIPLDEFVETATGGRIFGGQEFDRQSKAVEAAPGSAFGLDPRGYRSGTATRKG